MTESASAESSTKNITSNQSALMKLRSFFGYATLGEFRDDWAKLPKEDQEWFKSEAANL